MMKRLLIVTLAAVAVAGTATFAQGVTASGWTASEDKGLKLYTFDHGDVTANLVCDPESLWEPPEFHLTVTKQGALLAGNTVTVSSGDEAVTIPLSGGSILGNEREGWNKIIGMLSSSGTVTFAASGNPVKLDLDGATAFDCLRSVE